MSAGGGKKKRVVVAGTAFGRIYLDAVASAQDSFTLAGVLGRGSEFSRKCAERYGAPLYTRVEDIPGDIDIVCVVVRSGATGGPGSDLAKTLLERGIHVLQEHPVHAAEITACLKAAKRGGAAYAVNTLCPERAPDPAVPCRGRVHQEAPAHPVHRRRLQQPGRLSAARRDRPRRRRLAPVVVLRMRAARRAGRRRPRASRSRASSATLGGVPVTLRVQNQVHPEDPDNHSLLHAPDLARMRRRRADPGRHPRPVLWNPRLHSPRDPTGRLIMSGPGTDRLAVESTLILGRPAHAQLSRRVRADVARCGRRRLARPVRRHRRPGPPCPQRPVGPGRVARVA